MKDVKAHGNMTLTNLLINEYMIGRVGNLSDDDQLFLDNVKQIMNSKWSTFIDLSRQKCKDAFISMRFRGKQITWRDLPQDWTFEFEFGPYLYPTDFGSCCFLAPHLNLEEKDPNKTVAELYHGLEANSRNGETNIFESMDRQ